MYHFAKAHHVIDETELIVFNCADYANNPELLMSHLFGYAKVLLQAQMKKNGDYRSSGWRYAVLDEIHRLPPEGQEMIFTLWIMELTVVLGKQRNPMKQMYGS